MDQTIQGGFKGCKGEAHRAQRHQGAQGFQGFGAMARLGSERDKFVVGMARSGTRQGRASLGAPVYAIPRPQQVEFSHWCTASCFALTKVVHGCSKVYLYL